MVQTGHNNIHDRTDADAAPTKLIHHEQTKRVFWVDLRLFYAALKKYADRINTKYAAEIIYIMRKFGTELLETNYSILFHRCPDSGHMDGAPICWQSDGRCNET